MLIYGKNTTKEAILAGRAVYICYLDDKFKDRAILNLLDEYKIKIKRVSKEKLNELTKNGLHQGIVLEVEDYKIYTINDLLDKNPNEVLLLDRIEDPHNFGAIIRTAEAAGLKDIIIRKKGQTELSPLIGKSASGALEYVNIYEVSNLYQAVLKLKKDNYFIIGSSLDGDSLDKMNGDFKKVLIIGNEGEGISNVLKRNSDVLVKIPMEGKTNSLNASVAAALLIYKIKNLI